MSALAMIGCIAAGVALGGSALLLLHHALSGWQLARANRALRAAVAEQSRELHGLVGKIRDTVTAAVGSGPAQPPRPTAH